MQVVTALTRPVSLLRCRIGYRQPPASTTPKANHQLATRLLPQSRRRPPGAPRPCQLPPGGSYGACTSPHWFAVLEEVPAVNPSVAFGASSLWQGSLFAPGIVSLCDTGLFQALNRQRGNEAPQKPHSKTGAVAKTYHPSQSEGSISRWSHPGDS